MIPLPPEPPSDLPDEVASRLQSLYDAALESAHAANELIKQTNAAKRIANKHKQEYETAIVELLQMKLF